MVQGTARWSWARQEDSGGKEMVLGMREVVLGLGRGSWVRGGVPGHRCSELGSSPAPEACGEQELTPLLDKQVLVGR